MRILLKLLVFVFILICEKTISQSVDNVRAVQSGDDILIYYDLNHPSGGMFGIEVFCSENGGASWGNALQQIEGDANTQVSTGTNRKVVWHVLAERSELTGDQIQFEVRATPAMDSPQTTSFSGNVLLDTRDGHSYQVIKVNDLYWMAENLNFNGPGSYCYNNDLKNCDKYGRLYTWDDAQKSCPAGWRLASEKEWTSLESYLGMPTNLLTTLRWRGSGEGDKLKKGGPLGFDALYGGFRSDRGSFDRIGTYSYFWSATEYDSRVAFCRLLLFDHPGIYLNRYNKMQAMSVRCVRN